MDRLKAVSEDIDALVLKHNIQPLMVILMLLGSIVSMVMRLDPAFQPKVIDNIHKALRLYVLGDRLDGEPLELGQAFQSFREPGGHA